MDLLPILQKAAQKELARKFEDGATALSAPNRADYRAVRYITNSIT